MHELQTPIQTFKYRAKYKLYQLKINFKINHICTNIPTFIY